jgi:hypothetical protein
VLVVGLGVGLAMLSPSRRRLERELRASRQEMSALQARLDGLAARLDDPRVPRDQPARAGQEYVITTLPDAAAPSGPAVPAGTVDRREFASLVVGESVVRVASLAHGVRRALSAENRNRIGFEMRREVRRARKQRRRDLKEAKRQLRAEGVHRQGADREGVGREPGRPTARSHSGFAEDAA